MELSGNAIRVFENRYLRKDANGVIVETPDELFARVARNISLAELNYGGDDVMRQAWEKTFLRVMTDLDFLPNSPTLMNAGTPLQQLAACFVLPIDDTMESIFESVKHAALIHKSGGGTGFSFARLRPKDDVVRSTTGVSSGPVSFMQVFDAATEAVKQGGRRRGANMAILTVDHPDILDFVQAKHDKDRLNNFNISVALTETFMRAVTTDSDYELINPRTGKCVKRISAREVFDVIVDSAWRNGEPGIVFVDRMNNDNPTPRIGDIESTNPCGEQPLLPYESCNLGSLNLSRFVSADNGTPTVDYERLARVITVAIRFLDNVIDMSEYPVEEIGVMTRANRKVGLGVMGFADMLIELGVPYDSEEALTLAGDVMRFVRDASRRASRDLAGERGAFLNFAGSVYDRDGEAPIRNATTTTIAPTGTISILANTSSGIEPVFAIAYLRHVMGGEELGEVHPLFEAVAVREGFYSKELMQTIAKTGGVADLEEVPERWRRVFRTSHDIDPQAHIRMQAVFQRFTDNAVSKTVNLPGKATRDDVEDILRTAYDLDCKGVTIYRDGSREGQVLNIGEVNRDAPPRQRPKQRPRNLTGMTRKLPTGCGNVYVTVNDVDGRPFELFAQIGKAGGCATSQAEAIGRLGSLALRAGVEPSAIARQLRGVRCPAPNWDNGTLIMSCSDAIGRALEQHLVESDAIGGEDLSLTRENGANRSAGLCIDCGTPLEFDGGCSVCRECGYSRCG